MKRIILLVAILSLTSISALAQSRGRTGGSVVLGNGQDIIRIDINNRSNRGNLDKRVDRLERAVRQLQNRVYELEDDRDIVQLLWRCKLTNETWGNTYYGEASTSRSVAERTAHEKCLEKESFASSCQVGRRVSMSCSQD
jgi:hypothetical protein